MKKIVALIANVIMAAVLFAEAPELKNMMPNSWRKLTRLSEQEEKEFFEKTEVKTSVFSIGDDFAQEKELEKKYYQVFTETNCGIQFYRLLISDIPLEEGYNREYKNKTLTKEEYIKMQTGRECIWQIVFLKNKENKLQKILIRPYASYWASQDEWKGYQFNDLMIKPLNKNEIGFFITEMDVTFTVDREKMNQNIVPVYYNNNKNQIAASNDIDFSKYEIEENIISVFRKDGVISIQASSCLFDSKCPFKYSIQNAFDGNPATSYVENTNDDLMEISFPGYGNEYSGNFTISIINGYGLNESLYNKNNRVKKIDIVGYKLNDSKTELVEREPKTVEFKDGILNYQLSSTDFICFGPFYFKVSSIYSGNTYNDTCIAELNFKDNKGWFLEQ